MGRAVGWGVRSRFSGDQAGAAWAAAGRPPAVSSLRWPPPPLSRLGKSSTVRQCEGTDSSTSTYAFESDVLSQGVGHLWGSCRGPAALALTRAPRDCGTRPASLEQAARLARGPPAAVCCAPGKPLLRDHPVSPLRRLFEADAKIFSKQPKPTKPKVTETVGSPRARILLMRTT